MARTSHYGMRGGKMHHGTDYYGPKGDPVYAVADGTVTHATINGAPHFSEFGRTVVVQHGDLGVWSLSAHLDSSAVVPGQVVKRGQLIGRIGTTRGSYSVKLGRAVPAYFVSSDPHVHLEIRTRPLPGAAAGSALDPVPWLAARGLLSPIVPVDTGWPIPPFTPAAPAPPPAIARALKSAAAHTGVPYPLLAAVAHVESRYKPDAVSPRGAMGLMQLMPETAKHLGVTRPFDPLQSALGGATFLKRMFGKYGGWPETLAAYNWGPGNVDRHRPQAQWPSSVQRYVASVLAMSSPAAPAPSAPAVYASVVPVPSGGAAGTVAAIGLAFGLALALALGRR